MFLLLLNELFFIFLLFTYFAGRPYFCRTTDYCSVQYSYSSGQISLKEDSPKYILLHSYYIYIYIFIRVKCSKHFRNNNVPYNDYGIGLEMVEEKQINVSHVRMIIICHLSRVVRKPAFCICENKDADQLRGNREADQRLCFRHTDSTIPLLPKSEISSL